MRCHSDRRPRLSHVFFLFFFINCSIIVQPKNNLMYVLIITFLFLWSMQNEILESALDFWLAFLKMFQIWLLNLRWKLKSFCCKLLTFLIQLIPISKLFAFTVEEVFLINKDLVFWGFTFWLFVIFLFFPIFFLPTLNAIWTQQ